MASENGSRSKQFLAVFTGNDPDIEAGGADLYRDHTNWPAELKDRMAEYENIKAESLLTRPVIPTAIQFP